MISLGGKLQVFDQTQRSPAVLLNPLVSTHLYNCQRFDTVKIPSVSNSSTTNSDELCPKSGPYIEWKATTGQAEKISYTDLED